MMQKGRILDAPSDERQRMLSVALALLAVAVDQMTAPAIAPAMRAMQATLNIAPMTALWISIGFNAAYFAAIAMSFWFIIVLGKRVYFGSTFLGFAVASLACAVATGSTWLLVARVAQGVALGGLFTSALLTMMGACPPKRLPVVFAWFSVISLATPSFAPLFAGFTMGVGTWRSVFAVIAIPAFFGGLAGLVILRDPYPPKPLRFSILTFAALATFLLLFQYLVTAAASDYAIRNPWFAVIAVSAAAALGVYIIREVHSDAPFFDLRLFETPLVGQGATAGLLLGILLSSAASLLQFVQGPLHFDPAAGAALLAIRFVGIIVGVPLITILGGRSLLGSKPAMLVGLAIVALSFVVQHIMSTPGVGFWPLAAIGIVQGFAFAFVLGPLAAAIFAAVPPAELPSMAVIFKLSTLVGASLSIPLVTAFLDASIARYGTRDDAVTRAYADLWVAGAVIALVAASIVAALRIPPPHQSGSAA